MGNYVQIPLHVLAAEILKDWEKETFQHKCLQLQMGMKTLKFHVTEKQVRTFKNELQENPNNRKRRTYRRAKGKLKLMKTSKCY